MRPVADPKALRESTERLAAANEHLRDRIMGRRPSTTEMPAMPAVVPDAAEQLAASVKEYLDSMQPALKTKAARLLLGMIADVGITMPATPAKG